MSDRRDKKGRILRKGESQCSDGRYMYRYTDANGDRHTIYSWQLVGTDKTPVGKRSKAPLRDMEQRIAQDLFDDIIPADACKTTLTQAFETMMDNRTDLKPNTRVNYRKIFQARVEPTLGSQPLGKIRASDIKRLYTSLIRDQHYAVSTVMSVHNILQQIFYEAVLDHTIRFNPTLGAFRAVKKKEQVTPPAKKRALTEEEQAALVDFFYTTPSYQPYCNLLTVLLGTGMRIGEAMGLCISDCDFENGFLSVSKSLMYKETEGEKYHYFITTPKTDAGYREIPMLPEVRQALQAEIAKNSRLPFEKFEVDGYSDFVFVNRCGQGGRATKIYDVLQRAVATYNAKENAMAKRENRKPLLLPKISPHILRHTFCTRLCENERDMKVVQTVMGHKNITTTMNVYNDAQRKRVVANFQEIEGKMKLS